LKKKKLKISLQRTAKRLAAELYGGLYQTVYYVEGGTTRLTVRGAMKTGTGKRKRTALLRISD